jgi:hypothetical protein
MKKEFTKYIMTKKGFIGFYKVETECEEIPITLYPYNIKTISLKKSESGSSIFTIEVDNTKIELNTECLTTSKEFFKKIGSYSVILNCWKGTELNFIALRENLFNQSMEKTILLDKSGYKKINNKWVFASKDGLIDEEGKLNTEYSINTNIEDNFMNSCIPNQNDLNSLSKDLFNYNDCGIVGIQLGYVFSLFLRERLYSEYKIKSPNLTTFGLPGCGKTETLEKILISILNIKERTLLSAKTITPFTLLENLCSSNFFPVIMDDLKDNIMDEKKTNLLIQKINESYDRNKIEKGLPNLTIKKFFITSPLIIFGETTILDESNKDRVINCLMSKSKSLKRTKQFKNLCKSKKLLNGLGKKMLLESLKISDEEIFGLYEYNLKYVEKLNFQISTRQESAIAIIFTGLDFFEYATSTLIEDKIEMKKSIVNSFINSIMDNSEEKAKRNDELILEEINSLAFNKKICDGIEYKIQDKYLCLNLKIIFDKLDEHNKNIGRKTIMNKSSFTKTIKEEIGFDYKPVRFGKVNIKSYCIEIEKIEHLELESLGINCKSYENEERKSIENENNNVISINKQQSL